MPSALSYISLYLISPSPFFTWMNLVVRYTVLIGGAFGLFCLALYQIYLVDELYYTGAYVRSTDSWRWSCIYYCLVGAIVLALLPALFIDNDLRPMVVFASNADVAARAWKLEKESVLALMKANQGIFPHGEFITYLLAYPRISYEGARTPQRVNEERAEIFEQLEKDVRMRKTSIVF